MDLKRKIKVGDFVQYVENGGVVCDEDGKLLKVIELKKIHSRQCVLYENGSFDWLHDVESIDPLISELL